MLRSLPAVSTMNVDEVLLKLLVDVLQSEAVTELHPSGGHTIGGLEGVTSGGGNDLPMIFTVSTMLGRRSPGFGLLHAMPSCSSRTASSSSNSPAAAAASRFPST